MSEAALKRFIAESTERQTVVQCTFDAQNDARQVLALCNEIRFACAAIGASRSILMRTVSLKPPDVVPTRMS